MRAKVADGLIATEVPPKAASTIANCSIYIDIDLYHFLPHTALGGNMGRGSSMSGWTSKSGREFVAIGQYDGTAVRIDARLVP